MMEEIKERQKEIDKQEKEKAKVKDLDGGDDQNDFVDKNYWSIEDLEKSKQIDPKHIIKGKDIQ
jgi:hypothetical protein